MMKTNLILSAALVAAISFSAVPAVADDATAGFPLTVDSLAHRHGAAIAIVKITNDSAATADKVTAKCVFKDAAGKGIDVETARFDPIPAGESDYAEIMMVEGGDNAVTVECKGYQKAKP